VAGDLVVEVPALLDGVRVDRAVAMLSGLSRSAATALVGEGRVVVDGRVVTDRSTALTSGATLVVALPDQVPATVAPEAGVAFDVVFEDDQVVVVDKPAGLVVHPGAGRRRGTLVAGLLERFPDIADLAAAGVGDVDRPGIVHRIDKPTSGLLVVARTEAAFGSLSAQLAARTVERRYLALVSGQVEEERGVIDAPIGRSARTPTRMAVSAHGREARTGYVVRARTAAGDTLLELTLETGRTHQIRVHLAAIGHPVVGDDRYGRRTSPSPLPPGRLFLHAAVLGFEHPGTGAHVRWESPLPPDLAGYLAAATDPSQP